MGAQPKALITSAKASALGHRIKQLRIASHKTIDQAAEIMGMSAATLKRIEGGDTAVGFRFWLDAIYHLGMINHIDLVLDGVTPHPYPGSGHRRALRRTTSFFDEGFADDASFDIEDV